MIKLIKTHCLIIKLVNINAILTSLKLYETDFQNEVVFFSLREVVDDLVG